MKYYKLMGWHDFHFKTFYLLIRRRLDWPMIKIKKRSANRR